MFLDDELIEIGRKVENTEESIKKTISEMIQKSFSNLAERMGENPSVTVIYANFKRVNNQFKTAVDALQKENICFVKRNAFEIFVNSKTEFKGIQFS